VVVGDVPDLAEPCQIWTSLSSCTTFFALPLLGFGSSTISSSSLSTDFSSGFSGSSSSSSVTSSSARCCLEDVRVVDHEGGFADAFEEGPTLLLVDVLRAPTAFSFSSTSSASVRFRFVGLDSGSMYACAERDDLQGGIVYLNQASR